MNLRWTFLTLLLFLTAPSTVNAQDIPDPPPPDTAISWDVHRSLGVILVFRTDKKKLFFAHPIVMSHAAPECQGIKEEPGGDLLQITDTNSSQIPMRHIVTKEPTAYRYEGEDWQSLVGSTFHDYQSSIKKFDNH